MAISDALALNTEGLSVEECNFYYETENISLDNRICDYLRTQFPPHDWSSNTDVVVSLCCLFGHPHLSDARESRKIIRFVPNSACHASTVLSSGVKNALIW